MNKTKKYPTASESKQACEVQSTGKKLDPKVEELAQQVADQLASQEEPDTTIELIPVDNVIKTLETEGVEVHTEQDHTEKTFGDVMPSSQFYPDLPRESLTDILDRTYRIKDAQIVEDFEGAFGLSTFALMLCEDLNTGEIFTTLCGGMVVVKKIRKALDGKMLPLIGTIMKVGRYYDIQ